MSKLLQLKKVLVKNAIIASVVFAVFFAVALLLSNYSDSLQAEQSQRQSQNNAVSSEYREIQANLGIESDVLKYYSAYIKDYNPDFTLNRDTIADALAALRRKHHLTSIELTVSPLSNAADNGLILKSGKMVRSTVHIAFGALTDTSAYNFIYDLQHTLPGIVMVSDLKLTKKEDLSRADVLAAVNQHNIIPLVGGELSFAWFGLRSNSEDNATNGAGNAK